MNSDLSDNLKSILVQEHCIAKFCVIQHLPNNIYLLLR